MSDTQDTQTPPCPTAKDVKQTINVKSETDEASFESFPASDPPGVLGQRVGPADLPSPEPEESEAAGDEA